MTRDEDDWSGNYFNYFTEIEEHFQRARGTGLFLLSPLDWALIETWKNAGVPIEAVLRGIDAAFDKWRKKRSRTQMVNSLAFCSQAVLSESETIARGASSPPGSPAAAPFPAAQLRQYLEDNARRVREKGFAEVAGSLEAAALEVEAHVLDLEPLEQRLTALEDKLIAQLHVSRTEEELLAARRELDLQLRSYRGKMTAPQLAMLEKQFLERRLLEQAGLPRLSLFYLR